MKFGSMCSGIEAASVAFNPLGWQCQFVAEIEAFPSAVLAHHYPTVLNLGDMTRFKDWPDATLDVLCAGTPCQSFSNAGLRAGLDDPRGGLMLTFGAVAERYRPRWLLWENVPGVLSSNGGRDFGSFLGLLGFLGYGFAYRVLDAQYFGLAQRRKRVFVVACLGDWRSAAAVLFEPEGLRGDSAPRRGSAEDAAGTIAGGARKRGGYSADDIPATAVDYTNGLTGEISGTLEAAQAKKNRGHGVLAFGGNQTSGPRDIASALSAHGGTGRNDFESEAFIAHTLRGQGFDASEDGTGRGTPLVPSYTPTVAATMVARSSRGGGQTNSPGHQADGELIAFGTKQAAQDAGELCPTMTAMGSSNKRPNGGGQIGVMAGMQVRRLTPRECERLMGFPPMAQRIILHVCIDPENHYATVALSCLRWQSSASPADGDGLSVFASSAAVSSSSSQGDRAPLAALYVLPESDGEVAQISSRSRSNSCANGVRGFDWSRHHRLDASTALSLAHTLRDLATVTQDGKAASRLTMLLSTAAGSGASHALMSGAGIVANADDAKNGLSAGTFTTSELGRLTPICDSREATLCCSVMAVIAGSIQEETLPASFSLEATLLTPYTAITVRGKPAADGPRYKALGNSWAVPNVRWIGRRIEQVDAISRKAAA